MSDQKRTGPAGPVRDEPEIGDPLRETRRSASGSSGTTTSGSGSTGTGAGAGQVASSAAGQARDVASTAADQARDVARTAQGQARRLAGDARHELRSQADDQVSRLADGVGRISEQLRSMADGGQPGPVADMAREVADRAQQAADRLRSGGFDDTMNQVRRLGRNRPGVFLLGAFGAGLVAGRLVRNLAQDPTSDDGSTGYRASTGTAGYVGEPAAIGSTATTPSMVTPMPEVGTSP